MIRSIATAQHWRYGGRRMYKQNGQLAGLYIFAWHQQQTAKALAFFGNGMAIA